MRNELWADVQTDARTPKSRKAERERLQREYDEFVASGGQVTECPPCLYLDPSLSPVNVSNYGL